MAAFVRSVDDLMERNKFGPPVEVYKLLAAELTLYSEYKENHTPMPLMSELQTKKMEPSHCVVLGCLDPRANPTDFFGLKMGGCMVIRNAGGRANAAVMNDILVLDSLMGITDIVVTHHTDCGMTHATDAHIQGILKKRLPKNDEIDSMKFGEIKDHEQAMKDDIDFLNESPYLASKEAPPKVHGVLYDIKTGECQKMD